MFNISVSPPQLELILKPSGKFTRSYLITNNGSQTIYLSTSIKQWQPTDNNGSLTYLDQNTDQISFSLNNADLRLGQNFAIAPGQQKQIVLKLASLPDLIDQDYYFTLFFNQVNPGGTTSTALGKIGSHILISSSQNLSPQITANIKDIKITPKIKDTFLKPISFNLDLQNESSNFFKAEGKIVIQKNGKIIKELEIVPQNILAHSSHLLTCLPGNGSGTDNPTCSISPPFWPGPYTATLKLNSEVNYTSPPYTFLVLPYSIIVTALFISFLIFLFKKLKKTN